MTQREFFEAVANNTANNTEVREMAMACIEKLNARNLNRKPTAKQKENEALKVAILEYLADDGRSHPASKIASEMEVSTSKASALLRQLAEAGKIDREEKKVPKEGKKMFYKSLSAVENMEEEGE